MLQYCSYSKKYTVIILWLLLWVWFTSVAFHSLTVYGAEADDGTTTENATKSTTDPPAFETEYAVGIIDLTWSNIEPTTTSDSYPSTLNVDGHIAFYLKGKIRGKYLLTAQMDTGEKPIAELLQNLDRKDPIDIFSKIDPEKYYPIYGDQSTVINDVASEGKLFVRLEWDQSQVLLGDYQVNLNQTQLITYNRSLYGINVNLKKPVGETTNFNQTQAFVAEPLSIRSSDIIRATGGMLYYLKHSDIVLGSEQINVEIRSSLSGAVLNTIPLQYGRDYDLDYAQGRLILTRDLAAVIDSVEITTTIPNDGNTLFLVADYEYEGDTLTSRPDYGFRTSNFLSSNFRLGSSFVDESTDSGADYQVYGFDYNYQLTKNIGLNGEWAQSDQALSNRFYSEDGGLTYNEFAANTLATGDAWKIGFTMEIPGISPAAPFKLQTYHIYQQAGFSTAEAEILNDIQKDHLDLCGGLFNSQALLVTYDSSAQQTVQDTTELIAQLVKSYDKFKFTEELRYQKDDDFTNNKYYQDILGAFRIDYHLNDMTTLYGTEQLTLDHNEETPCNNRTILGTEINFNPKTIFNLEASTGDLGNSIDAGCQYQLTQKQQTYGKISYQTDQDAGQTMISTVGDRGPLSDKVNIYTERQLGSGTYENSLSNVLGVDYTPQKGWLLSFNYTQSQVDKLAERPVGYYPFPGTKPSDNSEPMGTFSRRIIGLGAIYHQDALQFKSGLEVRYDDGSTQLTQYLFTNSYRNELNQDCAYYIKLNYSITQDPTTNLEIARFVETTLGFAYRPVSNDRFNFIGEYTYLDELSPNGQVDGTLPRERSQIISMEGIYDLTPHWQLGEKLALKHAEIQLDPNTDNWAANDLYLWINRLNYRLPFHWEISAEYRILRDIQAGDEQNGFLVAVYYDFNLHNRIGCGYNFTDFNDNLAYLNYHSRGFFINFSHQW